jgi:hypothetical protein
MSKQLVLSVGWGLGFCLAASLFGQGPPAAKGATAPPPVAAVEEFPVVMEQQIIAGRTLVGTKVAARLVMATLVNGKVIPRDAVFLGEVVESTAKTSSEPSRLSIRMDSAEWKGGSAAIRVYLTSRYYPITLAAGPDLQYRPEQPAQKTWNGMGQYPDPKSPVYQPFPAATDADKAPAEGAPNPVLSKRPVAMKDVEAERNPAAGITLVSARSNLKLDKLTTYILAGEDALPSTAK